MLNVIKYALLVAVFLSFGDYHQIDWYQVSVARGSEVKRLDV